MRIVKLAALAGGLVLGAGTAHAQAEGGGPGSPVLVGGENSPDLHGPDERGRALDDANREAARARSTTRTDRAVPAKIADVTVGSEVRDTKGVVIGKIESLALAGAAVVSTGGKVEVPYESFGKNRQGLLLPVTKEEFDAMVVQANKPQ